VLRGDDADGHGGDRDGGQAHGEGQPAKVLDVDPGGADAAEDPQRAAARSHRQPEQRHGHEQGGACGQGGAEALPADQERRRLTPRVIDPVDPDTVARQRRLEVVEVVARAGDEVLPGREGVLERLRTAHDAGRLVAVPAHLGGQVPARLAQRHEHLAVGVAGEVGKDPDEPQVPPVAEPGELAQGGGVGGVGGAEVEVERARRAKLLGVAAVVEVGHHCAHDGDQREERARDDRDDPLVHGTSWWCRSRRT
jgi:hypothetical protein